MTKTIFDKLGGSSIANANANGIEPNPLVLKGDSDCMPPGSGHTIDPDNPVDDGEGYDRDDDTDLSELMSDYTDAIADFALDASSYHDQLRLPETFKFRRIVYKYAVKYVKCDDNGWKISIRVKYNKPVDKTG